MAEAPILWPPDVKSQHIEKDPDAGKDWGQEEKGAAENEMVGWHHQQKAYESEQTPGDREGQGRPACCSPWGCKELDTTEELNNKSAKRCLEHCSEQACLSAVYTQRWNLENPLQVPFGLFC